jgi:hypothetical protein
MWRTPQKYGQIHIPLTLVPHNLGADPKVAKISIQIKKHVGSFVGFKVLLR